MAATASICFSIQGPTPLAFSANWRRSDSLSKELGDPEGFVYPLVGIGLIVSCCVFSALLYRRFFGPCDMGTGGGAAAASARRATRPRRRTPCSRCAPFPGCSPRAQAAQPRRTPRSRRRRRGDRPRSGRPSPPARPAAHHHPPGLPLPRLRMPPMHSLSTPALTPQVPSCPPSPAHEPFEPMHSPGYMGYPSPAWGAPAGYGTPYHYSHQPHSF
nr:myb-related transcription factor, partner of profilin-like [Penaeus vannamei]